MKNIKIPHCRDSSKFQSKNRKITCKIDTPNTHRHDRSLSWLDIGTSIKSGSVKLV